MPQHIDYDKENERRVWWLNKTGGSAAEGLTVRDYFAAKALQVYLTATMGQTVYGDNVAENAYQIADAMMKARIE